jgi:hypothetical protein
VGPAGGTGQTTCLRVFETEQPVAWRGDAWSPALFWWVCPCAKYWHKAAKKAAAVAQKAAADAQKAQDKADRKAGAAAQKAAAVVQARTQEQEYVGWWAKCEDCGRWRVTHSIN